MSSPSIFNCEKCGKTTNHSRINDQYAGELWQCVSCGWKTTRDESKNWAKITTKQSTNPFEKLYEQDMQNIDFVLKVGHVADCMVMSDISGRFTAAQRSRIAAIILRSFKKSDSEIVNELKEAGFDLGGMMSSPEQQVARIKQSSKKYLKNKTTAAKKWWQFWK